MISIKELVFKYPDGHLALDGINLSVSAGESVGIIGSNGAGKSTLLLHLNGTLRPTTGTISISSLPVDDRNIRAIRRKVGMVFQDPDDQLFMPTVFEDIAFGLLNLGLPENEVRKKTDAILNRFGMSAYADKMPHHMSLGEKKKIALAGILVLEPEIIVFDEPTANLDPHSRKDFIEILKGLKQTRIIASHNLEMIARVTQRVIVINKGKIIADGPAKDIVSDTALLETNGLM
ncbi:MAG: ABC transporter ATP-binding protein [Planctomycetes bacterium]|nr:ABC transporter ATP-binding protein [Planctomycetota bacterium]